MKVHDLFIVVESRLDQARNGPYWQMTLQDSSGTIPARIWSPLSRNFEQIASEQIIEVTAAAQSFRDQLQLNIETLNFVPPEQTDLSFFLPVSSIPPEELYQDLMRLLHQKVIFPPWTRFYKKILKNNDIREALVKTPGGKTIHHAYMGGLLEHTLSVCRICDSICDLYPALDKDILLVSAALHDIGKAREISAGVSREYSTEGKLMGHIFLGLEMINPFLSKAQNLSPELIMHFKHIILSHHGELEYGSPKRPKTQEALLLHFADNLDAKMNTIDNALDNPSDNHDRAGHWSQFQRSMGRFLYNPHRTPKPEQPEPEPKPSHSLQKVRKTIARQPTLAADLDFSSSDTDANS